MAQLVMGALQNRRSLTGACLLAVFWLGTSTPVCAQDLQDPTRPPTQLQEVGQGEALVTTPVLQSVLISPTRKIAMIDGVAVRLNGKLGTQTLVKITETEVVLRQGRSFQTLKLHPDFEKKPVHIKRKSNSSAARP